MKFQVGVFATLGQEYDPETYKYVEKIQYDVHHWCDEQGIAYAQKNGKHLVTIHEFEFDEGQGVTREVIVQTMITGLREHQRSIQAEAKAQVTEIDKKINSLLALPVPNGWEVV